MGHRDELPPLRPLFSQEAEDAVLGALMRDNDAWDALTGLLSSESFYFAQNRKVFEAIRRLMETRRQADVLMVAEELTSRGEIEYVGGFEVLDRMLDAAPATANIRRYADIVIDRAQLRWLADFAHRLQKRVAEANGADAAMLMDQASQQLSLISQAVTGQRGSLRPFSEAVQELMLVLDEAASQAQRSGIAGTPTGLTDLDSFLGGLKAGQMIVIAGRPGMGKTSLAVNIAEHVSFRAKRPSAIFTMEMGQAEIAARVVSNLSRIHGLRLSHGKLSAGEFDRVAAVLPAANAVDMHVCQDGGLTLAELTAGVRRFKRQVGDVGVIVIDYFGLMRVERPSGNHSQDLGQISMGIKALAKEVKAPILLLAQLNREVEKRADKRPILADLRDSGSLEQDADTVLMVYRHSVYNEGASALEAEILIRKQRNGPTGSVPVGFDPACTRFHDLGDDGR